MIDWLQHSSVNRYLKLIKDSACSLMPGARRGQGTLPWVCCLQRIILCLQETMNIHCSLLGGIRTEAQIFFLWIVKGDPESQVRDLKLSSVRGSSLLVPCEFEQDLESGDSSGLSLWGWRRWICYSQSSSFHRGWECINNLPLWEALVCLEGSFPFELLWGFCLHARESQSKQ